jgi:hypothetical protein
VNGAHSTIHQAIFDALIAAQHDTCAHPQLELTLKAAGLIGKGGELLSLVAADGSGAAVGQALVVLGLSLVDDLACSMM